MTAATIACPLCKMLMQVPPTVTPGQRFQCPGCGKPFAIGAAAGAQPAKRAATAANPRGSTRAPSGPDSGDPPLDFASVAPVHRRPRSDGKGWWIALAAVVVMVLFVVGFVFRAQLFDAAVGDDNQDNTQASDKPDKDKDKGQPPPVVINPRTHEEEMVLTLPAEQQAQVNRASAAGIKFLRDQQGSDGTWSFHKNIPNLEGSHGVGLTALPGLTLLECGVSKDDSVIQKAARFIRKQVLDDELTYDIALAILFLDRLGDPQDKELISTLAMRLVAAQTPNGGWSYRCRLYPREQLGQLAGVLKGMPALTPSQLVETPIKPDPENKLSLGEGPPDANADRPEASKLALDSAPAAPKSRAKIGDLAQPLQQLPVLAQPTRGKTKRTPVRSDNSNTQFAILALWAARRHGVPVERTLGLVAKRFRTSQYADGMWGYGYVYTVGEKVVPKYFGKVPYAMTCAGLLGLAVGRGLTFDIKDPYVVSGKDLAVEKGLRAVGKGVPRRARQNKRDKRWEFDLYLLWSIERVGMLYKLTKIGGVEWYPRGVDILLQHQSKDGSWLGYDFHGSSPVVDTSLALLFLKRVNLAPDLTNKLSLDLSANE